MALQAPDEGKFPKREFPGKFERINRRGSQLGDTMISRSLAVRLNLRESEGDFWLEETVSRFVFEFEECRAETWLCPIAAV